MYRPRIATRAALAAEPRRKLEIPVVGAENSPTMFKEIRHENLQVFAGIPV